jgi:deoxyadenosine/deoxycytidine kinase
MKRVFIVSIEGNIGCGKSTLLDELRQASFSLPHRVIQENVKEWTSFTDVQGNNLLQEYYEDQQKYGYCFQSMVLITRVHSVFQAMCELRETGGIIVIERSHLTDLNIFAKTLYDKHAMTEIEWLTYNKSQELVTQMLGGMNIDLFVYLKASPSTCMQRIAQRHRKGEDLIPFRYISDLHDAHEAWLGSKEHVVEIINEQPVSDTSRSKLLDTVKQHIEEAVELP